MERVDKTKPKRLQGGQKNKQQPDNGEKRLLTLFFLKAEKKKAMVSQVRRALPKVLCHFVSLHTTSRSRLS